MSDSKRVAACLKHYIGYGASEAGRDYVYTEISNQTLWDTYIPPYEAGVKAGAATLMSSFNDISGTPGSANHYTMTEILKNRWKHDALLFQTGLQYRNLLTRAMLPTAKKLPVWLSTPA